MGLGKTKQAIDTASSLIEADLVSNVVVICPKTLSENWAREIAANAAAVATVVSGTKAKRIDALAQPCRWLVLHYEAARTLAEELKPHLTGRTLLICDEAHALKNQKTQVTKTLLALLPEMVVLMTGTPVANRPEDAFVLLQVASFDKAYSSWWSFRKWHLQTVPLKKNGRRFEKIVGYRNLEKLADQFAKYGLRRTIDEVLDLPEMIIAPRFVELEPEQARHYDLMKRELRTMVELESGETLPLKAQDILVQIIRLYQIASGFLQLQAGDESLVQHLPSAKLEALEEIVDELAGQKLIVWLRSRPALARLEKHFTKLNPAIIHGDITDRQAQVDKFNNDPSCLMFLGQLQSAHQGINLEKNCSHAVFFERTFSPLNNDQATQRIRRIGQTKRQVVIPIIAKGTVDERLTALLSDKADWRSSILRDKERLLDFIG